MQQYTWQVRVYYEDTDAGGVVYHARYLAFYERARTETLRLAGIEQNLLLNENIAFVVRKMTIDYFSSAKLDDMLVIESEITDVKKASLVFTQKIKQQRDIIINQTNVLIACIDIKKQRPIKFPQSVLDKFF